MQIERYVQAVTEDLRRMAAVGDENTARAADLLAGALESSLARRLQEAVAEAALELSAKLERGRVEVRVAGSDPELVLIESEPAGEILDASEEALSARVTLRLSETLKSRVEEAAATAGVSVNSWVVRTLGRAVEARPGRGVHNNRHRLTGYGRT
ncbi:MAG: toxin-antitoxin system HicB family antitoxin [Solirubrobacteraceae bacterium]